MAHLKSVYPYLVVLSESLSDPTLRNKILNKPKVLSCISEIVLNILKKNIVLSEKERKRLKKYKTDLYKLGGQKGNTKAKQKILSGQRGTGLLQAILAIGIPALIYLLTSK